MERRDFLSSALGGISLGCAAIAGLGDQSTLPEFRGKKERQVRLKGGQGRGVTHWDIITIGNLSRNRYWGESDERPLRSAICTCTVISGKDFHIMVDPSLKDEKEMITELDRRTGLTPDEIDTVFITHQHDDHLYGINHFKRSRWLAGPDVAKALNSSGRYPEKFEPAGNNIFGIIDVIQTPGHTPDHHSLRFDFDGFSVFVTGDAVATKDHWLERRGYYNVIDPEESKRTMEKINLLADIIVPGHDNYFLNLTLR